ncbi:polysaccharide biosynthesis tyrosine autokinase [Chamaesiphon sp. VAR_69_metabat_338]|uniref:GumC family protein n=1 Tax=Chamaesiphon sp. VAR_69_metabat_338 TaxID=2964704 RepID=UPI00286E93BD|nr:polysaccharide biosynthesis tyrosine autokinase [Chamaesiphon sp. VAR_69_metabat_338]
MSIILSGELKPDEDNNWRERHAHPRLQLNAENSIGSDRAEGGLDFHQVFNAIQRRIGIAIAINILTIGATIAWNRTRPPQYEGSFRILIEPVTAEGQVVSAVTGNQKAGEEQEVGGAQSSKATLDYPTQIQLLLSEKILAPVVEKLKPSQPGMSYDRLKSSLAISRFKATEDTKILEIKYGGGSPSEAKQLLNMVSAAYIQYSLSERKTNVSRAIKFVDTQLPTIQAQVQTLEKQLQTFREQNRLTDPKILENQLSSQLNTTKQEQQATQVELDKANQLYKSIEQQLQLQPKSAEAASVLSDAPGYQQLVKQLQDIDVELENQLADLTEEHPKVISLREKRRKLLPLLEEKAKTLLGGNLAQSVPNAQSLPYQNALRQDLSKQYLAAATQVQVLDAKLKGLNAASQSLTSQTEKLPTISRQYENLERQLKTATEQVNKFLQKREDLKISAARQEVPWELIAAPTVRTIESSGLAKDLALGSILGLLLGTGMALVVDKMNDVIYSLKDLRDELNIPILGVIPRREDEQRSLTGIANGSTQPPAPRKDALGQYRFSPFLESFRALNSQLRLLSPDAPIRSIVVSSSLPDEGKTTISIQLAQAAAAMGQRVLLVNTDLRKPSLQALVGQHENDFIPGLTDIIAGTTELMDTVQLLPGEENLYILLAGSVSLDPTSILSSKKMRKLMEKCQHNFDLVIYDTVPLNFADSLLLIPHTDGLLMVNRLGKVHREILRNSLRTLTVAKVPVLGLVVNMATDRNSSSNSSPQQPAPTA